MNRVMFALAALAAASAGAAEMFPFVVTGDVKTNAANVSFLLDAPAGKDGFVQVDGDRFTVGGRELVFHGTGLTGPACFPTHESADKIADSIARFGFNCIRLHFMDTWYRHQPDSPQCIFAFPKTNWEKLDPGQLDKLDYLVAALKRRGVYVDVNLHVGRVFGPDMGFPTNPVPDGKLFLQFVPRMGELMRTYSRDLLTHVNKYTGNAYADEPAVALVEISNENSFDIPWRDETKGRFRIDEWYYNEEYYAILKGLWNAWRKEHLKASDEAELPEKATADEKTKADFRLFLDDVDRRFYCGMRDYLKKELKVKCPVAGTQVDYSPAHVQAELDYVDQHYYWHHPEGDISWANTNCALWHVENEPMVNSLAGLKRLSSERVAGKPFTISEYNHPRPNFFGAEAMPMLVSWGLKEKWNGMFLYTWNHYPEEPQPQANPWCLFDMLARADAVAHLPATATLVHRRELGGAEGEVVWDRAVTNRCSYRVDTANVKVFTGFTPRAPVAFKDGVTLSPGRTSLDWSTVSLVSLDGTGFGAKGAARLLLAATAKSHNSGEKFRILKGNWLTIEDRGTGPVVAEGVPLSLTLGVRPERVKAWALNGSGERVAPVAVVGAAGGSKTQLSVGPAQKTLWYEIEIGTPELVLAAEKPFGYGYGDTQVQAGYRAWLKAKYGEVKALNAAWHTDYASFDAIRPATRESCVGRVQIEEPYARAKAAANYIDFRAYRAEAQAAELAARVKALRDAGEKRTVVTRFANADLTDAMASEKSPTDVERLVVSGLVDRVTAIGYETRGADDRVGLEYDLVSSFARDAKPVVTFKSERHTFDADLADRSAWTAIGKGAKDFVDAVDPDSAAAKDFAALKPFLATLKRSHAVRPVGLYYSRTANAMQPRSYGSTTDCGPDSIYRVYELVRANGYPVVFVTDEQILDARDPALPRLGAFFMIDAAYMPSNVCAAVEAWTKRGGTLFADAQPAIYDEHGYSQSPLFPVFGIRQRPRKKVDSKAAENLQFGYSCYAFDVINPDGLHTTQCEMFFQYDSTHPVIARTGKMMLSTFGCQNNHCTNGQIIVMNQNWSGNASAGVSARRFGQGNAYYMGAYLGGAYGAACSQYEWRDDHSEDSPYRLVDAILACAKMAPVATTDLPPYEARQLRFESPLVGPGGVFALNAVNYSALPSGKFTVRWLMAPGQKVPKRLTARLKGGETRELKFEVAKAAGSFARELVFEMPSFRSYVCVIGE